MNRCQPGEEWSKTFQAEGIIFTKNLRTDTGRKSVWLEFGR